jgi:Arc/MetJ family transcription regulator
MAKHLVDLDEELLGAARAEVGTTTIKDTVNESLRRANCSASGAPPMRSTSSPALTSTIA